MSFWRTEDTLAPALRDIFQRSLDTNINTAGVCKLLEVTNPHKACGPDQIPNVILKNCDDPLVLALTDIFQRSLDTAVLPSDWRTANMSAVFKKRR